MIHELGHALTIRKYGLPAAITLRAFGGYASFPADKLDRKQSFVVTAAGPALQFVFGVLLIVLAPSISIPEGSLFLPFLRDLIWVSIAWSILNCLPVYPMDGGQMMAAILGPKKQHNVHLISSIVAVIIGIAGYLLFGQRKKFVVQMDLTSVLMRMLVYCLTQQAKCLGLEFLVQLPESYAIRSL